MLDLIVTVNEGKLKGDIRTSSTGFQYNYYLSIPYAKPPIGELRFKDPQPSEKWNGIRDATFQRNCNSHFDITKKKLLGSENSLFLNVYAPSSAKYGAKLAVMFMIHGGGFYVGSGDYTEYRPDFLVEQNVVFVSINYRLGPLGFLCLHNSEVPGNAGLKDQVLALKWVQKNINVFGGDPDNVTIVGESAGSACVHYHIMSPMSKGLIRRGIMQSGTCISKWAIQEDPLKNAFDLGEKLGLKTTNKDLLLQFLRSVPVEDLIEVTKIDYIYNVEILFCGTIEKSYSNVEAFLLKSTLDTLSNKNYNMVPSIHGFNSHESLFLMDGDIINNGVKNGRFLNMDEMKVLIKRHSGIDPTTEQAEKLYSFYFNDDIAQGFVDLVSDLFFIRDAVRTMDLMCNTNQPAYLYYFNYEGILNAIKPSSFGLKKGACHDDEECYLYITDDEYEKKINPSPTDSYIRKLMTTMWTNFAKFGEPTIEINDIIKTKWTPSNSFTPRRCLHITNNNDSITEMTQLPFLERVEFWKELNLFQ